MTSQVASKTVLKTKPLAVRRFQMMALEHIEKRAARIRSLRQSLGLSQEGLADRMQEVHQERHPDRPADQTRGQMVSDWERAINEPSPRKLELLAAALDTTVAALNTDAPDKSGPTPDPFAKTTTEDSDVVARVELQLRELLVGQSELTARVLNVERLLKDQRKRPPPESRRRKADG